MYEPRVVDGLQPFEDLARERRRPLEAELGVVRERASERAAAFILVGDIGETIVAQTCIKHGLESFMGDRPNEPRFAKEAVEHAGVGHELCAQDA